MIEVRTKIFSYKNFEIRKCYVPKLEAYVCYDMTVFEPESERKVYVLRLFLLEFSLRFKTK